MGRMRADPGTTPAPATTDNLQLAPAKMTHLQALGCNEMIFEVPKTFHDSMIHTCSASQPPPAHSSTPPGVVWLLTHRSWVRGHQWGCRHRAGSAGCGRGGTHGHSARSAAPHSLADRCSVPECRGTHCSPQHCSCMALLQEGKRG